MKAVLLTGSLLLTGVGQTQAQQAYLNCNHYVATSEERMVEAIKASINTGRQHPDFCKAQIAANTSMNAWLKAAETCRSRMADYDNRVAQVRHSKQIAVSVILQHCKIN